MYALVRPGPYACAEWEEGGYPAWLSIKPGMVQREMGPVLPYSDPYMTKVEAIVAKHQLGRGGNVFLLQLENEHSRGWGTDVEDPYLKHLDDQARANGIEIPMFNSGLHHSHDPSGETPFPSGRVPVVQHRVLDRLDRQIRRNGSRHAGGENPRLLEGHRLRRRGVQLLHGARRHQLRLLRGTRLKRPTITPPLSARPASCVPSTSLRAGRPASRKASRRS